MNIAIVVGSFPQLSETFVINHIISLIDAGHKVTIFTTHINKEPTQHKVVKNYSLIDNVVERPNPHIGINRYFKIIQYFYKYRGNFKHLIKAFNPRYYGSFALKGYFLFEIIPFLKYQPNYFDIVHAHFGENGNKMAYIKELGIISSPLIVSFHGHDVNHVKLIKKQANYKALKSNANLLIFNSRYLLNKFKTITNLDIPCFQIPVGINPKQFTVKSFNNSHYPVKFITVARLVDCKGINLVLEALKKIECNSYEYHIVGDGPNLSDLKKLAKNNGISKNVFFHGKINHDAVIKKLKDCDVFILFGVTDSNGEIDAQGLVVQEAQACGLPVIVSDGGGLPEGVINNQTGFVVKEGDIKKLEEKLSSFIKHTSIIKEMGLRASSYSIEKYSQLTINNSTLELYEKVKF